MYQSAFRIAGLRLWTTVIVFVVVCSSFSYLFAGENRPPEITYFGWSNPWADYFMFYGTIVDEDPASCLVMLNGVMGDNYYASVDEYGNFYLIVVLEENAQGGVSAICIDSDLQQSEYADTVVFY